MKTRYSLIVLISAGVILALAGVAKLWSALGTSKVLNVTDPLLGISYKHLLAGVAVMEIVVATICFFGRSRDLALALVAYLSTNFRRNGGTSQGPRWGSPWTLVAWAEVSRLRGLLQLMMQEAKDMIRMNVLSLKSQNRGSAKILAPGHFFPYLILVSSPSVTRPAAKRGEPKLGPVPICLVARKQTLLLAFLITLGAMTSGPPARAQRFVELSAEIELISYQARDGNDQTVEKRRIYPLKCTISTNVWRIDTEFLLNAREQWYYDSTNVYRCAEITKDMRSLIPQKPGMPAPVPFLRNEGESTITITPSPGGYPVGNLGVNIPWLAFCSGSYLKQDSRVIPLPVCEVRSASDAFSCKDVTEVFDDELGLPRSIRLFPSSAQHAAHTNDSRLSRNPAAVQARVNWPADALKDEKLKFEYHVRSSTNFDGWTFPTEFSYVSYAASPEGLWQPFVGGVGRVLDIHTGTPPPNVFRSDKAQSIVDYRFRAAEKPVDAIMYRVTNIESAPSTNDAALQSKFLQQKQRAGATTPGAVKRIPRWAVLTFLILSVVAPLWLSRRFKSTNPNQSNPDQ